MKIQMFMLMNSGNNRKQKQQRTKGLKGLF